MKGQSKGTVTGDHNNVDLTTEGFGVISTNMEGNSSFLNPPPDILVDFIHSVSYQLQ